MTQPSTSTSQPRLKTRYKRERAFEPIYTGGAATALTPDGNYLFAPVNETIHITQVTSGKTVNKIPSDLEEVSCLALTSDGKMLLIASRSLAIRVVQIDYLTQQQDGKEEEQGEEESRGVVTWKVIRNIAKTHDAPVVVMRIDPTDTLLATGSSDGSAKVWDIRGGFCTHVFRNHGGIVSALEWNMPESNHAAGKKGTSEKAADRIIELFTGSVDGKVRLWNLKEANERGPQRPSAILESHFSVVRGLAVNKDGTRLVSAGRDRLLTFWERQKSSKSRGPSAAASGWRMADSLTAGESMESAGFLADSSDVFWTAGAEGEIRLWSFESRTISNVQPMGRFAKGLASKRNAVINGEDEEEEEDNATRGITEVHSLPFINALVSVHADQNIVFRRVPTLQRIRRLVGFNDQIIDMALLSSASMSDSHLAVATNTNSISVYTLGSEEHSVELLPGEEDFEQGHTGLVLCMDKTSDGRWLASGAKDRSVRIWARIPRPTNNGSGLPLDDSIGEKVSISSNGQKEGDVEMQWRCVAIAEGHTESVGAVAFARRPAAPDAEGAPFLVSGSQDRTAKVWDLSKLVAHIEKNDPSPLRLTSLTTLKIHDKDINALDVSPNNALLLTGSQDKTAKVFSINYVAPSKANSQTAIASLKLVTTCRGHKRGVWSVAFSPNDAVFLTGSGDRSMKLWSINSGFTCIKNYIGHTNSILKVRFLKGSKGLQCLSCASDGLVKVWNVKTEECMDTLDGHEDRVWGLECSRDGDTIISGAADSFICFWKDWTVQQSEAQIKQRQEEVEREQQFNNLLAVKDYRNAISLALAMNQPRRLFNLFTTVDNSRSQGDSTTSTGDLLNSALQSNGKAEGNIDPSLQALVRAGVLSMASAGMMAKTTASTTTPASISGSSLVDQVLETLHSSQLRALLGFVRDWNTSARTSHIAQLVLHAILRFHSADDIVSAFDKDDIQRREKSQREEEEKRRTEMRENKNHRQVKRQRPEAASDLRTVIESILPYTKRHYDRAQRLLTESAMLQYTLACMDSVLGAEGQDDEGDMVITESLANGHANGDILMNGFEKNDGEQSSDEEMASEEAESEE
jgi:U3 small nucleolar RNA-associated protein 13